MQKITKINSKSAKELVADFMKLTECEVQRLSSAKALPMWYATCYLAPGIHSDCADSWGEFADLVRRVFTLTEDSFVADERLYPAEVQKAGIMGIEIEITDEVCDHCRTEFIDPKYCQTAFDKDGKSIKICDKCSHSAFECCEDQECEELHVSGLANCPVCGCSKIPESTRNDVSITEFKCPKCGSGSVFEIIVGAVVLKRISGKNPDGNFEFDGKIIDEHDAHSSGFQCEVCEASFSSEELKKIFA